MRFSVRRLTALILVVVALLSGLAIAPLRAYDIYDAQPGAFDIPSINATLRLTPTGTPIQANVFGERTINIQAYFDTGASGVLMSEETARYLGVTKAMNGTTPVTFADVGVGGTETFGVSTPYYISLAPFNDSTNIESAAAYNQTFGPIQMQLAAEQPLGSQLAGLDVFGMPVFAGKVVVINPRPADPLNADGTPKSLFELGRMNVNVYNPGGSAYNGSIADPGIPEVAHHIKLSYGNFNRFTTVTPAGSTGPTLAHNPFIGPNPVLQLETNPPADTTPPVTFGFGGLTATGSFLLDTGAAASMISRNKAAQLNIRYRAGTYGTESPILELFDGTALENQFTLTVGGIGGTKTMAGFYLSDLILPTMEGSAGNSNDPNHLHYHGAPVLVNDISLLDPLSPDPQNPITLTLDGILGMNLLTGSVELIPDPLLGFTFGAMANGAYNWLVFDEPNGILGVSLKNGPAIWQGTAGSAWNATANWGGNTFNGTTSEIRFTTAGSSTANLDTNQTVNKLTFAATTGNNYTLVGAGKLTLDGTTPVISTTATNTGTQTIAVNLDLAAGTTIMVNGGTLNLNLPADATLGTGVTATIANGATLNLGGTGNALSNGTTAHANVTNHGTLAAITAGKRVGNIDGAGSTNVTAAGASLTANSIRQSSLMIGAGNSVTIAANSGASRLNTLSINATGKLDLADNDLIVVNGNLAALTAQLRSGLDINSSYGNGPGITSNAFATNPAGNTVLGVAPNSELGYTTFAGQPVGANDVLIKYTYFGDADLNGVVDTATDFDLYITGMTSGGSLHGWLFGDFDYNGAVDSATDFDLYITGLTSQGGALLSAASPPQISTVPEPGLYAAALLGFLAFSAARYYRNQRDE